MNVEGTRDGSRLDDSPLSRSLPSLSSRNFYLGMVGANMVAFVIFYPIILPRVVRDRDRETERTVNIGRRANDARESEGTRDTRDEIPLRSNKCISYSCAPKSRNDAYKPGPAKTGKCVRRF